MQFEKAVEIILFIEKGYVNDPKDAGGETNWGICKRQYPDLDIRNLTPDQAKEIYKKDYWDACKADSLPDKIRLAVFDCSINQGTVTAIKLLQKCLGVEQDGVLGKVSLSQLETQKEGLLEKFIKERIARYAKAKDWEHFGVGWMNRIITIIFKNEDL